MQNGQHRPNERYPNPCERAVRPRELLSYAIALLPTGAVTSPVATGVNLCQFCRPLAVPSGGIALADQFEVLVTEVYDAAVDPRVWPIFLERLRRRLGAEFVSIVRLR